MLRLSTLVGIAILGMAFLVGTGTSQDAKKELPKTKAYTPPGWKAVGLTKEQTMEFGKIHELYKAKIKALEDQINEAKTNEKKDMVKLLTDEQKEKLRKAFTGDATGTTSETKEKNKEKEKK